VTDPYVHYKAKFDQVKEMGTQVYNGEMKEFIQDKVTIGQENLVSKAQETIEQI